MSVRILEGDAFQVLQTLPDCSVQMCVTSPPYFGLRDYGVVGQLGLEKTPQLYVDAMVAVFSEVKRVLRDDGSLWLNIGDSYNGSGAKSIQINSPKQMTSGGATSQRGTMVDGCKPKDLIGIPWLLAFALRADGWYLRSDIIWHKPNPMPESVTDRPTKSHEYLFLLSKSPTYYYDADAIKEPHLSIDATAARSNQHNKGSKYEARLDLGGDRSRLDFFGEGGRNKRSVWTISTSPYSEAHFATFPPKLIEPCILAGSAKQACEKCGAPWVSEWSRGTEPRQVDASNVDRFGTGDAGVHRKVGGQYQKWMDENPKMLRGVSPTCDCENSGTGKSLILDPFGGAGTTGLVADRLGRDALLIELNPKYAEMARRRIHSDNPLFGDVA